MSWPGFRPPDPEEQRRRALAESSDEDLLAEVWRRFGESWCSFSSGVRSAEECPGCNETGPMTRHHLVPVARGAGRERSVKARYVKLCRRCHDLAHEIWGPGDAYRGPEDREVFLRDLRARRSS